MLMKFIILNFILHKSLIRTFHFGNCDFNAGQTLTSWNQEIDIDIRGHSLLIQFHSHGFYLSSAFVRINFVLASINWGSSRSCHTECHRLFASPSMLTFKWIIRWMHAPDSFDTSHSATKFDWNTNSILCVADWSVGHRANATYSAVLHPFKIVQLNDVLHRMDSVCLVFALNTFCTPANKRKIFYPFRCMINVLHCQLDAHLHREMKAYSLLTIQHNVFRHHQLFSPRSIQMYRKFFATAAAFSCQLQQNA